MISLLFAIAIGSSPVKVIGLDGESHDPLKLSGGKPQAFIFVNHDCPVCNGYSPEFARIEKAFGSNIKIQLVFSEPDITVRTAKTYEKTYRLTTLRAWVDTSRKFAAECGATVVPEAVLFDANGSRVWAGRIDDQWATLGVRREAASTHDLRTALASLAEGKRPRISGGKPVGCFILSPEKP